MNTPGRLAPAPAAPASVSAAARFPSALIDRVALPDGRVVVVRPVLAFDADAAQAFVRGLSPESRLKRFHFGLRELPPPMLRAMTEVDHDRHVAIVAESIVDPRGPLWVADARYVRGDDPRQAEFGIAVADAWQGAGLGRELLRRLMAHAAREGVRQLAGDVMAGNRGMLALAAHLGGRVEASPEGPGVVRVVFALG
jgi:acetyltransferase